MKRFLSILILLALSGLALPAQSAETKKELDYKKKGVFLGGELGALVGFDDGELIGAPGKLDFLVGYQINPYVSVAADLWTFWFIAYAAEAHVKANFTDSKISPYAVGTAGIAGVINAFEDGGNSPVGLIYSAGLGVDFHLWKQGTLFTDVRYRGGRSFDDDLNVNGHGLEMGVGFRWMF